MDKYEYKVKLEQIEKMAAKKDYVTAAKIADGIDWRKVKSVATLLRIADIYEENQRLEECYELLNMVYDRSPMGRRILYRMTEVAVRLQKFEEAIQLYKEFVKVAPHDLNRYILKYQILRGRGSSLIEQIAALEEFKNHEYDERWAYELACLYEEAGNQEECIEACDELILWFSEGEYVVKAMELKLKYQELTAAQQEKYEHRFEYLEKMEEEFTQEEDPVQSEEISVEEEVVSLEKEQQVENELDESPENEKVICEEDTPQVKEVNVNKFSTINLQKELAQNLQEILGQMEEENDETMETEEAGDTQEFVPFKTVVVEEVEEEKSLEDSPSTDATGLEIEKQILEDSPSTDTADLQTEILKYATVLQEPKMEELYRTEEDGQMILAIGSEDALEKQITGQMTIEEVLEAWEEKKRQLRAQIEAAEAKKPAVLFETGEISRLLEDFIPKTPKEVEEQFVEEVAETEKITEVEEVVEAEVTEVEEVVEAEVTEVEEVVEAEVTEVEEVVEAEVTEVEEVVEAEVTEEKEISEEQISEEQIIEEEVFEDDLPQDIDLEEVLGAFFEEPEKEEEKQLEECPPIGENTASMIDAIERALSMEMTSIETDKEHLTEEQEKIFAYFTSVKGMKKQLIDLLAEESNYVGKDDSKEGNLIITGHPGNGKTTLAIDIVKAFQKQRKVKGAKIAKVSGDGFNKKNPEEVIGKLGGGALIIERAGSLKDESVELLSNAMESNTGGLLVILEDDAREIERLMSKHENFAAKFNRSVDIPIFSNDELVAFGKSYAAEKEYFFDDMAVLALYDSIGVRQTMEHVVNITEVKEFVDDAIAHAEKKRKGLIARLLKKRIDEYGNKLLLEEDFSY